MRIFSHNLKKRLRREKIFRNLCRSAILFALGFLLIFVADIVKRSLPAFHQHYLQLEVVLDSQILDPLGDQSHESLIEGDYLAVLKTALRSYFPEITQRREKRKLYKLISINSPYILANYVHKHPKKLDEKIKIFLPLDDEIDLFLKYSQKNFQKNNAQATKTDGLSRNITKQQLAWTLKLQDLGYIKNKFNFAFFINGNSRESETAGIFGALVGSFWLLVIVFILAIPLGVLCAIYLTEFAPKNRLTDFIEVNINNLAAVPSIVFGLLGLAIFLNFFAFPRSTPFVGGLVLALMSMPTIIIVTSTALVGVPKAIREAALGLGASKMQTVFHHVLPICFPSILTVSIIAIAQALGETAPLLMIGMVAFIVGAPNSPFEPSSALPVQIFMWADIPEHGFLAKSAAAIVILMVFLISFNLIAVILRQKFSKKL